MSCFHESYRRPRKILDRCKTRTTMEGKQRSVVLFMSCFVCPLRLLFCLETVETSACVSFFVLL